MNTTPDRRPLYAIAFLAAMVLLWAFCFSGEAEASTLRLVAPDSLRAIGDIPAKPIPPEQADSIIVWQVRPGEGSTLPFIVALVPWLPGDTVEVEVDIPDGETHYVGVVRAISGRYETAEGSWVNYKYSLPETLRVLYFSGAPPQSVRGMRLVP